jgi:predicted dehydrogenase
MSEKKIKWGVIGSGGIARRRTIPEGIIPAENATLLAVFDIDRKSNREVAYKHGAEAAGYDAQQSREESDAINIDPVPVNTYLAEIVEFSDNLLENRTPGNNADIGLQSQKILAACYRSAATGLAEKVNQNKI